MKNLMICWENFQDQEVLYPYYRLQECGSVDVMSNTVGKIKGILGVPIESNLSTSFLNDKGCFEDYLNHYDLLVLPGGVKSLEKLRQEKQVIRFISEWNKLGKVICSTCHGAQLLISAKVVKGRRITGYYSLADDIENSGAIYVNEPVVVDDNIVSSPHYKDMPLWLSTGIKIWKEKNNVD